MQATNAEYSQLTERKTTFCYQERLRVADKRGKNTPFLDSQRKKRRQARHGVASRSREPSGSIHAHNFEEQFLPDRPQRIPYLALGSQRSPIPLCPHDHKTTGKDGLPKGHADECKSPGKAPLWEWKQFQEHRCEENNIKYRWNCVPEANVGVCMGPVSGLVGLDIDGHEGIDLLTEWQGDNKMPDTAVLPW